MNRMLLLYRSILGKKAIVAVTGAIMLGFLLAHASGNLKAFLPDPTPGVPDIDVYAHFLRTLGEPLLPYSAGLWAFRAILALALVLHIVCVLQLALHNKRARPVAYECADYEQANASGRWMLFTGSLLLVFLVIHILHFTTGTLDPPRFVHEAPYTNLYLAFQQWSYAGLYLTAMALLSMHLYHGTWSLFQSLGLDNPDRNRAIRRMAFVIALALPLAFALVPVSFLSGLMNEPPSRSAQLEGEHRP